MIERDHCSALSGAIEALESSTVRLPVGGGARVFVLFFFYCDIL